MSQQQPQTPDGADPQEEGGPTGPVIRDKRRVDPQTGQVRAETSVEETETVESDAAEPDVIDADTESVTAEAGTQDESADHAEPTEQGEPQSESGDAQEEQPQDETETDAELAVQRLEDLRRLQAEFVNYRRRVDRDRSRDKDTAVSSVVESLLPVMDDIHSAREHGELVEGPFAAIADKLESTLGRFGVERFGASGEVFDPTMHEALMHSPAADLPEGTTETTIVTVIQPGFRVGERLVRPARVAVADPA